MNTIVASIFLAACVAVTVAAPGYGSYGSAPVYSAPAPVYGHQTYSYPSPAPSVRCGSNLLIGCAPQVANVGCGSYSPPSYGGSYGAPSYGGSYGAPSYGGSYGAPSYSAPAPSYSAPAPSYGGSYGAPAYKSY